MSIRRSITAVLLVPAFMLLCGFTWNFGLDKCKDALDQAKKLPSLKDDAERSREESKILAACPDSAAAYFVAGMQAERIGNLDGAISSYRRALQSEPSFAVASGNLGVVYLQKGLLDDAALELTKGLAGAPSPAYHRAMGKVMLEKRIFPLAMHHMKEAAAKAPSDPSAIAGIAEVYAAQNQLDLAQAEYQRASLIDPSYEPAFIGLAQIYLKKNEQEKALELLKKASVANPRSSRIHLMLAEIYDKKGDVKQAEYERLMGGKKSVAAETLPPVTEGIALGDQLASKGEIEKAAEAYKYEMKIRPDAVQPYDKLCILYFKASRDVDAIPVCREANYRNSSNHEVYYSLGQLYERRKQMDEAVVSYKRAIEKKADFADARLKLADIRLERGNVKEAVEQYGEFLRLKPESADIHLKLARIFVSNKELALAEESYKAVLKLAPDNLDANRELAGVYRSREQNEKAVELYKKVLSIQKDDAKTREALVTIYVKNKQYDQLLLILKEAVDIAPEDPVNHYKLGLIYEFRKEYDNAIASMKKAVELKPDHARALQSLGRVYMKTGRLAEAREALEAAKKADPNLVETSVLLNNIRDDFNPAPQKPGKFKKGKSKKGKKAVKTKKPAPGKAKPAAKKKTN